MRIEFTMYTARGYTETTVYNLDVDGINKRIIEMRELVKDSAKVCSISTQNPGAPIRMIPSRQIIYIEYMIYDANEEQEKGIIHAPGENRFEVHDGNSFSLTEKVVASVAVGVLAYCAYLVGKNNKAISESLTKIRDLVSERVPKQFERNRIAERYNDF